MKNLSKSELIETIELHKQQIKKLEECLESRATTIEVPVHKFEVYPRDAYLKLEHDNAVKYCKGLGDGWRLRTASLRILRLVFVQSGQLNEENTSSSFYYWNSFSLPNSNHNPKLKKDCTKITYKQKHCTNSLYKGWCFFSPNKKDCTNFVYIRNKEN